MSRCTESYYHGETKPAITECLIDGVKQPYDRCAESSKVESDACYKDRFKYIGSSYIYFINGHQNTSKNLHHFYIKI